MQLGPRLGGLTVRVRAFVLRARTVTRGERRRRSVDGAAARDPLPGSMPIAEILDPDAVPSIDELTFDLDDWATASGSTLPVATDADLGQFDHLPPMFGPGLPVARPLPPPADGDDSWPMVA
jgi:hypothetical protein